MTFRQKDVPLLHLPKISRLDLRRKDFFTLRAIYEWDSFSGSRPYHVSDYMTLDQGCFLPVQNWMLDYYSAYQ